MKLIFFVVSLLNVPALVHNSTTKFQNVFCARVHNSTTIFTNTKKLKKKLKIDVLNPTLNVNGHLESLSNTLKKEHLLIPNAKEESFWTINFKTRRTILSSKNKHANYINNQLTTSANLLQFNLAKSRTALIDFCTSIFTSWINFSEVIIKSPRRSFKCLDGETLYTTLLS